MVPPGGLFSQPRVGLGTPFGDRPGPAPNQHSQKKNAVLRRKTCFLLARQLSRAPRGIPMHDQTNQIWGRALEPKWPNKVQSGWSSKTHQKNLFPKDAGELQTICFHSTELRFIRARARSLHTPNSPPHQHRTAPRQPHHTTSSITSHRISIASLGHIT